jgi:multiple sugar transport system substrate-binding protein
MKSRFATALSLLLILATLVACGASATTPGTGETPAAPTGGAQATSVTEAQPTTAPEATTAPQATPLPQVVTSTVVVTVTAAPQQAADEPKLNADVSGNVELWHFWASPVRRNGVRRIIAMCQQQLPNIKVTDTVKPFGDIWTANLAAVAAGSGMPDVIVSDRPQLPKDAADGVYQSLQELADRDNVKRDQFYPWAWDQTVYENQTYGIPFETDVRVLFWNKQAFTEAGLDPEKPPTTWAELEAMADKLDKKNADGTYSRIAFMPLWNAGPDIWSYTNDAEMIAADGKPQINNPKMVETLTWIKKWIDRYGGWQNVQAFAAQFGAPPNDIFMSGGVAMLVDIFGYNSQLTFYRPQVTQADGNKVRMDWGIGMMPYNTDPGDWSGGFSLSIPTGAQNKDAAWEFIKCMTGYQGQVSWARDTQAQPTNLKAAKDPVLSADPAWQVVDKALSVSTGGVFVPAYSNWYEQVSQRLEKVWTGDLTPQQALDEAQAAVEAEVNK